MPHAYRMESCCPNIRHAMLIIEQLAAETGGAKPACFTMFLTAKRLKMAYLWAF